MLGCWFGHADVPDSADAETQICLSWPPFLSRTGLFAINSAGRVGCCEANTGTEKEYEKGIKISHPWHVLALETGTGK